MSYHYQEAFGEFASVLPDRGCPRFDGFVEELLQLCPKTASDQMILDAMAHHFETTGTSNISEAVQVCKIVYGEDAVSFE